MTALRLGSLFDGIGVFPLAAVRFTDNADGLKKQAGLFSRKPLAVADLREILTR